MGRESRVVVSSNLPVDVLLGTAVYDGQVVATDTGAVGQSFAVLTRRQKQQKEQQVPLRNASQPEADGNADGDGNKEPRGKEDKEDTPHPDRAATGEILQEETSAQVEMTKGSTAVQTQEEDEPDRNGEGGEGTGGEMELQDGELEETLDRGVQETLKATPKQLAQWQQQDASLKTTQQKSICNFDILSVI